MAEVHRVFTDKVAAARQHLSAIVQRWKPLHRTHGEYPRENRPLARAKPELARAQRLAQQVLYSPRLPLISGQLKLPREHAAVGPLKASGSFGRFDKSHSYFDRTTRLRRGVGLIEPKVPSVNGKTG